MRVTIIGAGVIGLSTAWELSRRGADVRIVERGQVGKQTSWAAAGILPAARYETATDPLDRLRGWSHDLYPSWCDELFKQTGIDSGLRRSGGIYLASQSGEAASLLANLHYQRELGIESTSLTAEQVASEEPELSSWANSGRFRAAVLSPDEWQIRPPDFLAALLAACQKSGVQIDEYCHSQPEVHGEHATVKFDHPDGSSQVESADHVVICGGAWTGDIASQCGLSTSVIPIRGQMLMYRFASPPIRRIINEGHRYLVPRDDGRVIVGSCEEEVGFKNETTREMLDPIARWAESILPCLVGMNPERSWSALRPATYDGLPLIGKVPDTLNLHIASGHYRSGIHLAPATATLVADMLTHKPSPIDPAPFSVSRMVQLDRVFTTKQVGS